MPCSSTVPPNIQIYHHNALLLLPLSSVSSSPLIPIPLHLPRYRPRPSLLLSGLLPVRLIQAQLAQSPAQFGLIVGLVGLELAIAGAPATFRLVARAAGGRRWLRIDVLAVDVLRLGDVAVAPGHVALLEAEDLDALVEAVDEVHHGWEGGFGREAINRMCVEGVPILLLPSMVRLSRQLDGIAVAAVVVAVVAVVTVVFSAPGSSVEDREGCE